MWYKVAASWVITPETLIVYCIILIIIKAPNPHSFAIESVIMCHFKTFRTRNLH